MTTNLNDTNTNFINDYCQQMTKQLLDLAQTFARKSRRPSTQLKCTDLINAFDCMNVKTIRDKEQLSINSFDHMLEIEYK